MEQITAEQLEGIFHSSDNPRRQISTSKMQEWLDGGFIAVCRHNVNQSTGQLGLYFKTQHWLESCMEQKPPMLTYHISQTQARVLRWAKGRAHGGDEHVLLSKIGAMFLRSQGKSYQFEQWFNRKRVDILSIDHEWVVECGDTQARSIIEHLYGGDDHEDRCNKVAIIPFQPDFPNFFMYIFTRGPAWDEVQAKSIFWREDISTR
jgi:hypothetical protein